MSRRAAAMIAVACVASSGVAFVVVARHKASVAPRTISAVAVPVAASPPRKEPTPVVPADFVGVLLPRKTVNLAARLDGKLAKVTAEIGAVVHEGDLLAALDTKLSKHDLAMALASSEAARAARAAARVELDRARDRKSRRDDATTGAGPGATALVSGEEIAQARFDERSGAAKLRASSATAAQEQTHVAQVMTVLEQHQLRAPFDGVVSARFLDQGAYVKAGDPVVRIVASGGMVARFAVPEERVSTMKQGDRVRIVLDARSFDARLARISPEVEPSSRTVFVEATSDAASGMCNDGCAGLAGRVIRVTLAP